MVINDEILIFVEVKFKLFDERKSGSLLFYWPLFYWMNFEVLGWVLINLSKNLPLLGVCFKNWVNIFLVQNEDFFEVNLMQKITSIDFDWSLGDNQGLLALMRKLKAWGILFDKNGIQGLLGLVDECVDDAILGEGNNFIGADLIEEKGWTVLEEHVLVVWVGIKADEIQ